MRVMRVVSWLIIAGSFGGSVGAQAPGQTPVPMGRLIPIPYRTYIALNPSLVVFDFGSLEVESGVAPGITIGGVGSYAVVSGDRYTSADLKVRFYPGEVVLRGVSVGLSAGFLRYSKRDTAGVRVAIGSPTVGFVTDYNWMVGPTRRFLLGTGVGAKRVLASTDERRRFDLPRSYLTARFVIGYAF